MNSRFGQPEFGGPAAAFGHRALREIDAHKAAAGQKVGHWDEVAAAAAAYFEYPARGNGRGFMPNSVATEARRSGCVCAIGMVRYGT